MPRPPCASCAQLRRLYTIQGKEIKDIATHLGLSYRSVWQRIHRCGLLIRKANRRLSLLGNTFGRLRVIGFAGINNGSSMWRVQCDCGTVKIYKGSRLTRENRRSCGCDAGFASGSKHPLWSGHGEISGSVWAKIVETAKKRKLPVRISIQNAWELYIKQGRKCAISGAAISFAKDAKSHIHGGTTASLDRIDSLRGYVAGNVQWLHKTVNRMKWDSDPHDFISWCRRIAKFKDNYPRTRS